MHTSDDNALSLCAIADIATEEWKFRGVFRRMLASIPYGEHAKYNSRYSWFSKKVEQAVQQVGLQVISVEGQPFDVGMAVTPLNLEDFEEAEDLYVEQMIEPILMKDNKVFRTGTVILGRAIT